MNVASLLHDQYKKIPNRLAVSVPKRVSGKYQYTDYTFKELENRCNQYANVFKSKGITRGMKVLLFVKPSFDFPAVTFALFKLGAIPIMIDPGMGLKNLFKCVSQVKPEAMVGIGATHIIRRLKRSPFKTIKIFLNTSSNSIFTPCLPKLADKESAEFSMEDMQANDTAAILFTSGGTGVPKGVVYTHYIFIQQTHMLQKMFNLSEQDIDCPGFPLFALFTIGMGVCAVIPDMNPSKPAKASPERLVSNIIDKKITFVAGSPAIWEKVADYCLMQNIKLDSVKYLVMFGAPVRMEIHEKFSKVLPNGTTYTPYGATECLPVACISGKELLSNYKDKVIKGSGVCVGKPAPGVTINIVKITDDDIEILHDLDILLTGQVGEVVVDGPTVTPCYHEMPEKTKNAKIHHEGRLLHRMGDLGYLDKEGQLWFCGRKDHRVETAGDTFYSIPTESIFNTHPLVNRTALVKVNKDGKDTPALVIERKDRSTSYDESLIKELKELSKDINHSKEINDFYFHEAFPVDVRHNIKIDRKKLWHYAQSKVIR